jgi:glycosyltransferase involved in cell wall biosynthesis
MRVCIDASYARRGHSGTGVYVERLIEELRALGVDVRAVTSRSRRYLSPADLAWTHVELPRRARGCDVLHHPLPAFSRGFGGPQVVTVHDLAFIRVPECFNARFRVVAGIRHRAAVRRAAAVVAVSEATAADVRSRWGVSPIVALHGPGQFIPANRGEPRHFLYVGDEEPRKNLERLREAARGAPLPLVEARGVSEAELADLHRHAAALVIPSLHEGFGLPALEAMAAGTPVLAARTAGLAEVCGDAARYCDPRDTASIAAALTELATVPPLREELRRRGVARAAAFSWRASAEAHLRAYNVALRCA